MDVEADAEADPAQPPGYIIADANELSAGSTAIFPCAIRYMDLTTLELENCSIPVKPLTLIRDEWNFMIDLFNARKPGIHGSAIFTGSPGISEHLLSSNLCSQLTDHQRQNLPLILYLNPLHQPFVFQNRYGDVYLVTHEVQSQTKDVMVPGDPGDVLTLVDADSEICQPYKCILRNSRL